MSYGLVYYLITILGKVLVTNIIILLILIAAVLVYLCNAPEQAGKFLSRFKVHLIIWFGVSITTITLVPSQKDLIIITGLHIGTGTINSTAEAVSEKLPKLNQLINQEIDKLLKKK